ncbi:tetratricopeptide repeat protein [Salinivibrio kushneri]|uniref:Tetratricopeptide repeat protein n=1 Tax=Salinivibrio kushneri TaxID=1908198 RepID=A0AA47LS31_9GAMM|nr:hypothetical protein [Salinivibrio kushneri]WBA09394.1 hypothetical protein N8M53_04085 [Salinivibrio kushneri]
MVRRLFRPFVCHPTPLCAFRGLVLSLVFSTPLVAAPAADIGTVSAAIQNGDYQQALSQTEGALAQSEERAFTPSERAELHRLRAIAYLYLDRRAEAYRAYRQALTQNGLSKESEADALTAVISLAFRVEQYEEVLSYARQLREKHTLQPTSARFAMQAAYALSRFDVAIDYARQLQKLGAEDAFILQTKGLSEVALSRFDAAAATFDKLVNQPDVAPRWLEQAARAHAKAGSHQTARQYLARANTDIALYRTLSTSLLEQDAAQQALLYWQQGLQQLTRLPTRDEQLFLVQCLIKTGQRVAALNRISEVNLSEPDKQTLKLQVMLAYQLNHWQEVIDTAQVALSYGLKDDRMLWQWLSISAIKAGDYALADYALEQWEARDPTGLAERWRDTLELLKAKRAKRRDARLS